MIRPYIASDLEGVLICFNRSVREIASRFYTSEQVAAWAPERIDRSVWETRFSKGASFVAESNGTVAGFVRADESGYIDVLYVHPEYQRQGIGRALLDAACEWASDHGAQRLESEVSLAARRLFESAGFTIEREQLVERRGVQFRNFRMTRGVNR